MNQPDQAFDILQKGIAKTDAARLKIKFAELAKTYQQHKQKALAYLKNQNLTNTQSSTVQDLIKAIQN